VDGEGGSDDDAHVQLHSLLRTHQHNGVEGEEVLEFDASVGRWQVQLDPDGLVLAHKASNLEVLECKTQAIATGEMAYGDTGDCHWRDGLRRRRRNPIARALARAQRHARQGSGAPGSWQWALGRQGQRRTAGPECRKALTPSFMQCAKCKAAAYCSKARQVPAPPTHMQRAAPEPAPLRALTRSSLPARPAPCHQTAAWKAGHKCAPLRKRKSGSSSASKNAEGEIIAELIKNFDKDGSGGLDIVEVSQFLQEAGGGRVPTHDEVLWVTGQGAAAAAREVARPAPRAQAGLTKEQRRLWTRLVELEAAADWLGIVALETEALALAWYLRGAHPGVAGAIHGALGMRRWGSTRGRSRCMRSARRWRRRWGTTRGWQRRAAT
jgi:hypothetical protein